MEKQNRNTRTKLLNRFI